MKILFLEPFFGGSHKAVAQGFARHSSHEVEIVSLPPRFWKWRMRGAALAFVHQIEDIGSYDLIFATAMMDLTDFKALAGPACPPILLYFHENQLSYPLAPGEKRDFHLGFTNIISALAADHVVFNSRFHLDDFLGAARDLIQRMPDQRPSWMVDAIEKKTGVLYPGCDLPGQRPDIEPAPGEVPLVIWNHRWEFDKKPDLFFEALKGVKEKGVAFELAVLGEQYDKAPRVFETARRQFADQITAWGFLASVDDYRAQLSKGTCVVSTAIQENFGISVVEAMAHGCFPLLPNRLSYPELVPKAFHETVIYDHPKALEEKLIHLLSHHCAYTDVRKKLSAHAAQFSWKNQIKIYDHFLENLGNSYQNNGNSSLKKPV